jgi:hypothetical protein
MRKWRHTHESIQGSVQGRTTRGISKRYGAELVSCNDRMEEENEKNTRES